jgi:hypothetical protein
MFDPEHYLIATKLFTQLLGVIYFAAFAAFLFQMAGLLGEHGILPVSRYLDLMKRRLGNKAYYWIPTLFWLKATDRALIGVTAAGTICSLLLLFNIYPLLMLLLLYILYLSILSVGQEFLSFGWEMFLMEITVNAIFLNLTPTPHLFIWFSLNLLLFRFHFQGGIVKLLSCDPNWRNMTACAYHYQTQPIPNLFAWYVHKFPLWFHKAATVLMFFIELVVPFGIFAPWEEVRLIVFFFLLGLQLLIYLTGNFSYLNHLTVVLSLILVSDRYWSFLTVPAVGETILSLSVLLTICGAILLALQLFTLWNHLYSKNSLLARLLYYVQPLHLVSRYGIFAVMTTKRYEVVVEGSEDGKEWKEYTFYYKPSELDRRPRRISPFQPRLDWQIWFLPFSNYESEEWFQNFMSHLLLGTKEVLALLRHNPFPDKPPRYARVLFYDYVFSDYATKKRTGHWWERTLIGNYSPVMTLRK